MANDDVIARPVIEFVVKSGQVQAAFDKMRRDLEQQSGKIQTAVNSSFNKINQQSFGALHTNAIKTFNSIAYSAIRMGKQIEQALKMVVVPAAGIATYAFRKMATSNTDAGNKFRAQFDPVKKSLDESIVRIGYLISNSKIFGKTIVEWTQAASSALNKLSSGDVQRFINLITSGMRLMLELKAAIIGIRFAAGFLRTIDALSKLNLSGLSGLGNIGGAGSSALAQGLATAGGAYAGSRGIGAASVASQNLATKVPWIPRSAYVPASALALSGAFDQVMKQGMPGSMGQQTMPFMWPHGREASKAFSSAGNLGSRPYPQLPPGWSLKESAGMAATGAAVPGILSKIGSVAGRFGPIAIAVGGLFNGIGKIAEAAIHGDESTRDKLAGATSALSHLASGAGLFFDALGSVVKGVWDASGKVEDRGGIGGAGSRIAAFVDSINKTMKESWDALVTPAATPAPAEYSKIEAKYISREDAKTRLAQITKDFNEKFTGMYKLDQETSQIIENYKMGRGVKGESSAKTAQDIVHSKMRALEDTFAETNVMMKNIPTSSGDVRNAIEAQLNEFQRKIDEAKSGGKLGLPTSVVDEMEETMKKLYDTYHAYMSNLRGNIESDKAKVEHEANYRKAIFEKDRNLGEAISKRDVDSRDWMRSKTRRIEDFNDFVKQLGGGTRTYDKTGKYAGTTVSSEDRAKAVGQMNQLILNRQEKMGKLGYTGESYGFAQVAEFSTNIRKKGTEKQEDIATKMLDETIKFKEATLDHAEKTRENSNVIEKLNQELEKTIKAFQDFVEMNRKGMPAGEAAGYNPIGG